MEKIMRSVALVVASATIALPMLVGIMEIFLQVAAHNLLVAVTMAGCWIVAIGYLVTECFVENKNEITQSEVKEERFDG